jgi:hypothetical protein
MKRAPVSVAAIVTLASLYGGLPAHAQDAVRPTSGIALTPLDAATVDDKLRSGNSTTAALIHFVNRGDSAVDIYWINFAGDRVLYRSGLAVGATWDVSTFLTHPWLVVVAGTGGTTTRDTGTRIAGFEALTANGDSAIITGAETATRKDTNPAPAPPQAKPQEIEHVYQTGERVGNMVVGGPTIVHEPAGARLDGGCKSNPNLRSVGVSVQQLVGSDGNVHDVSITKVTVWVAEGDGRTLINESDPRWKDFTSAIEAFKKQAIEYFSQQRYRPAMLNGAPVAVRAGGGVSTSCSNTRN